MGLPKQIRNQIKQGKQIEGQLRKEQLEDGSVDTSQQEIDNLLAEVTSDDAPADNVTELHPKQEDTSSEPKPERTDWKQKYSVLKGKYDAEVPRLSQDLRDSSSRISKLEDRLTTLAVPAAQAPPEKPRTDFTPEEVADYGEDLLDVIGRKARAIVEAEYLPRIDSLTNEVTTLHAQLGETGQRVQQQETNEVFAQLDREVKDWRTTNVDPEFHEWLDQLDPFSGETRKNLLLRAFNRKNARQVKLFFDKYAQENAAVVQPSTDGKPSGQGGKTSTLNLEDYIAPGQPRSGGDSSAPNSKRMWSASEISMFYSDVQKGRYKNRPEDKIRIEADLIAATSEGRVKP